MRLGLALLILAFCGCATVGDLQEIADANHAFQQEIRATLTKLEENTVSVAEAKTLVVGASAVVDSRIAQVQRNIEARGAAVGEGIGMVESGGIATLITAAGLAFLNWRRNRTRGTDPRVSNRSRGAMRAAMAPFIVVILILLGCTAEAFRRLAASSRLELYGSQGSTSTEFPRIEADSDTGTIGAAVSFDLIPQAGVDEERRARQESAALEARLLCAEIEERLSRIAPTAPSDHESQPEPAPLEEGHASNVDGDTPAVSHTPWYASTEAIGLFATAVTGLVAVWQRDRIGSGVQEIRKRHRARKAQKESSNEHPQ